MNKATSETGLDLETKGGPVGQQILDFLIDEGMVDPSRRPSKLTGSLICALSWALITDGCVKEDDETGS